MLHYFGSEGAGAITGRLTGSMRTSGNAFGVPNSGFRPVPNEFPKGLTAFRVLKAWPDCGRQLVPRSRSRKLE